jgi:hypothetical protein
VAFRLVYVDPATSADAIKEHRLEYGLTMDLLRDPEHALVKASEVRVTPEAAVFVPGAEGARLVYHGRVDDRYLDFGRVRPFPTTHELADAIEAVLEGRPVPRGSAPAVGCFIDDVR